MRYTNDRPTDPVDTSGTGEEMTITTKFPSDESVCGECESKAAALTGERTAPRAVLLTIVVEELASDAFSAAIRFDEPILTPNGSLVAGVADVVAPTRTDALCRLLAIALKESGPEWSVRFGARLVHSVPVAFEASPALALNDYSWDEVRADKLPRVNRRTGKQHEVAGRPSSEGMLVPWHHIDPDVAEILAGHTALEEMARRRKFEELLRRYG